MELLALGFIGLVALLSLVLMVYDFIKSKRRV